MKQTTLPTLSVGDAVVIRLDNGTQQSAVLTHFSTDSTKRHRRAHFAWKTGPGRYDTQSYSLHSSKWTSRVVAVFPAGCKFLAI